MKLSIGILAHNEENNIESLLYDLINQTIFDKTSYFDQIKPEIEIIVVCNGCTDETHSKATKALKMFSHFAPKIEWTWQVKTVLEAGKSNAWNLFVHEFANKNSEFFCFLDADIALTNRYTIDNLIFKLQGNSEYWIALDTPVKDVQMKLNKTIMDKLSLAVSRSSNKDQLYICGQLYCCRAESIRKIHLPIGLPVEDGYLTQVIISEHFQLKDPTFKKRIVRDHLIFHLFKAEINPFNLIKHEVRVTTGIVINHYLIKHLEEKALIYYDVNKLIFEWNSTNKNWLDCFVKHQITDKHFWTIPLSLVFRRYRSLANHSFGQAFIRLPIATLAFLVDLIIMVKANNVIRSRKITNFW
jgi:glycosyltransferase involved in cell wall biosynthesis